MRITCPNCNAQYEIAPDVIPADGRDVQCSNCGTTWFQEGRGRAAAADAAPSAPAPAEEPAAPTPRRPMADEQTLSILREEREREDRLRAAETGADPRHAAAKEAARLSAAASVARARAPIDRASEPVPTVDDDDVADAIAQVMQDSQFDDESGSAAPAAGSGAAPQTQAQTPRRALLPDIEEINSSLRPDERAAQAAADAAAEEAAAQTAGASNGSGFRLGFAAVIFLMMLAVLVYIFAAPIVGAVPALAGVMETYVDIIERGRVSLEAGAESLLQIIGPDA